MPRKLAKKVEEWKPDLDRFISISALKEGKIIIGGDEVSPDMYEVLRTDARMFEESLLLPLMASAILNEAARYALDVAKIEEPADIRSQKLAFGQGLAMVQTHLMNFVKRLSHL